MSVPLQIEVGWAIDRRRPDLISTMKFRCGVFIGPVFATMLALHTIKAFEQLPQLCILEGKLFGYCKSQLPDLLVEPLLLGNIRHAEPRSQVGMPLTADDGILIGVCNWLSFPAWRSDRR